MTGSGTGRHPDQLPGLPRRPHLRPRRQAAGPLALVGGWWVKTLGAARSILSHPLPIPRRSARIAAPPRKLAAAVRYARRRTRGPRRSRRRSGRRRRAGHTTRCRSAVTRTATLGRSHGPRQPEIVSWTARFSFSAFQMALIRSTGTSGKPRSVRPQQQPLQSSTCAGELDLGRQGRAGSSLDRRSKLDPQLGLDARTCTGA